MVELHMSSKYPGETRKPGGPRPDERFAVRAVPADGTGDSVLKADNQLDDAAADPYMGGSAEELPAALSQQAVVDVRNVTRP